LGVSAVALVFGTMRMLDVEMSINGSEPTQTSKGLTGQDEGQAL